MSSEVLKFRNVREFSLRFFDEPFERIGIFRGVHYRLIKRISTTVCGVYLILRFLFRIKQWVEVKYTKVLVYVEATGRGLTSKPDSRTFLGSFLDDGFRHKLAGFASFGIRASVLVSGLSILQIFIFLFFFFKS